MHNIQIIYFIGQLCFLSVIPNDVNCRYKQSYMHMGMFVDLHFNYSRKINYIDLIINGSHSASKLEAIKFIISEINYSA